jgi:S-adenosylmethionine:tRNA ribosyltransferase-isomerase
MLPQQISIDDFDYNLPDERIAIVPVQPKDESQLLVYKNGNIDANQFLHIAEYLPDGMQLIGNNSKVIPARIYYTFDDESKPIEIFILSPVEPNNYDGILQHNCIRCVWKCLVGNARKWKANFLEINLKNDTLKLQILEKTEDAFIIEFSWLIPKPFIELLDEIGNIPLPPYIKRKSNVQDASDYQTLLAQKAGSVAAPTAGLHFTQRVVDRLAIRNIHLDSITLHVGAGTFKPVKSKTMEGHIMHSEYFSINKATLLKMAKCPEIALVGTTTLRSMESAYWIGYKLMYQIPFEQEHHISQWEVYEYLKTELPNRQRVFRFLHDYLQDENALTGSTQIIIAPSYQIQSADALITNFHQPKSTLLLLVSACIGLDWRKVYEYALQHQFRMLSYGDSSLLFINKNIS